MQNRIENNNPVRNLENYNKLIAAGVPDEKIDLPAGIYAPYGEENAIYVSDYPFGFTARVVRKIWIETKKNQVRFCVQTSDKGNGLRWCAPKKSTYTDSIIAVRIDSNGHYERIDVMAGLETAHNWQDADNNYKYNIERMENALLHAIGLGVVNDERLAYFEQVIAGAKKYNARKDEIANNKAMAA